MPTCSKVGKSYTGLAFPHLLGPYCNSASHLLTTLTHSLPSSLTCLSPVATLPLFSGLKLFFNPQISTTGNQQTPHHPSTHFPTFFVFGSPISISRWPADQHNRKSANITPSKHKLSKSFGVLFPYQHYMAGLQVVLPTAWKPAVTKKFRRQPCRS